MSHTQIVLRDAARAKVLAGATALTDAVRVTLGPKSRCVLRRSRSTATGCRGRSIIDATKVVRLALENAVSVADVLLLSEATLTEIEEKRDAAPSAADLM
jgi:chaperonin GroEL (HSP60 family)